MVNEFHINDSDLVLDPFVGCGTTLVETTLAGINAIGIDINPFLCFIARVKSNFSLDLEKLKHSIDVVTNEFSSGKMLNQKDGQLSPLFKDKPYFSPKILAKIIRLKNRISELDDGEIKDIFNLGLASILLKVSNLRRGPDLAYRKVKLDDAPVFHIFKKKMMEIYSDLASIKKSKLGHAEVYQCDAKKLDFPNKVEIDFVITSPPYLNGTNYVRNTKLELWILDFISQQREIRHLRELSITAGICDVYATAKSIKTKFSSVERIVAELKGKTYDRRIPMMIAKYFDDIYQVLSNIHNILKMGKNCIWVVGDSLFSNIYVPTDVITAEIGTEVGFKIEENRVVRKRRSRNGFKLHESVLIMKKVN